MTRNIPSNRYEEIRSTDVNLHKVRCDFNPWRKKLADLDLGPRVEKIEDILGDCFGRSDVIGLYRRDDIQPATKFLAAMIWGHEAPAGSKKDGRGPWKVSEMFSDPEASIKLLESTRVGNEEQIRTSYRQLNKGLKRCGPNFFSKHFYFLGKARGTKSYPLILDDRVAAGLAALTPGCFDFFGIVKVVAARRPESYLEYLSWARRQAENVKCDLDQVEYFLFKLGAGST